MEKAQKKNKKGDAYSRLGDAKASAKIHPPSLTSRLFLRSLASRAAASVDAALKEAPKTGRVAIR